MGKQRLAHVPLLTSRENIIEEQEHDAQEKIYVSDKREKLRESKKKILWS